MAGARRGALLDHDIGSITAARPGKPSRQAAPNLRRLCPLAGPVLAVLALYCLFIAARLALHGGDPSAFVAAGDMFAKVGQVPPGLHVLPHSSGYDGQAYYRLALEPWTSQVTEYGIRLDNPAYRQQRLFYPLLAWLLSFGRPALVPAALIAGNLLGLGVIAASGAALARRYRRPAWWGVLPALYPGFLVTLALDLSEIVEGALLLGGILLLLRKRYSWATLCFTLAIFTRETALLVPVALAMAWVFDRLRRAPLLYPARVFTAPLAAYLVWQGLLWSRWHGLPFRGNGGNIGIPGAGFAEILHRLAPPTGPADAIWLLEIAALAIVGLGVLAVWRDRRAPDWLRAAWLLNCLLVACLGASVWVEDIGFLRALTDWYVVGTVLLIMDARAKPTVLLFAPALALWGWMWLTMALL
ncbi:MAG TPA: hypothetical protein VGP33_08650 [Chloroflexota bacterium]|nr:hypothetical protein [Chloroflexota bacterium]